MFLPDTLTGPVNRARIMPDGALPRFVKLARLLPEVRPNAVLRYSTTGLPPKAVRKAA